MIHYSTAPSIPLPLTKNREREKRQLRVPPSEATVRLRKVSALYTSPLPVKPSGGNAINIQRERNRLLIPFLIEASLASLARERHCRLSGQIQKAALYAELAATRVAFLNFLLGNEQAATADRSREDNRDGV